MTLRSSKHTPEIQAHLIAGDWPQASSAELQAHAAACRSCSDLILVTSRFQAAKAVTLPQVQLPPPGILWWRAQLRRRNVVEATISRPLLGAHIFALAICVTSIAALFFAQPDHGQQWMMWLLSLPQYLQPLQISRLFGFSTVSLTNLDLITLIPGIALLALLTGVILYLATEKQQR